MLGFFGKKKNQCPIPEETRIWIENSLIWLINQFEESPMLNRPTAIPTTDFFPIEFNGQEKSALEVMNIVAKQMDIDPCNIVIDFYTEQLLELRSDTGYTIFGEQDENENYSAGRYMGKNAEGKFVIAIERAQLKEPDKLIATISHELAHIKILGENRLNENDEYLTDLVTVFYGLGIFNANTAFKFYSSTERWAYSKQGYLTQQEWGYALALYAYIRSEQKPDWIKFLTPNIQSDFAKSENYIYSNQDKVLV